MTSTVVLSRFPRRWICPPWSGRPCAAGSPRDVFRRVPGSTPRMARRWIFYEGPPTANGKPGAHHVEARVFKDLFPRFKTMKGFHVPRRAGWDCHGLPVELAVEKELGFTSKQDIEEYGIAEFNAKCRESALSHVAEFEAMTRRMGYWVDLDNAYLTMSTELCRERLVVPEDHLRRGTAGRGLSGHPLLPARRDARCRTMRWPRATPDVVDPSVYVVFPLVTRVVRGSGCVAAGLDDHPVDAGVEHRGRAQPGPGVRAGPGRGRPPAGHWRRPWSPQRRRRAPRSWRRCRAPPWSARPTRGPSTW